jgi:hypothetical protein
MIGTPRSVADTATEQMPLPRSTIHVRVPSNPQPASAVPYDSTMIVSAKS